MNDINDEYEEKPQTQHKNCSFHLISVESTLSNTNKQWAKQEKPKELIQNKVNFINDI